MQERKKARKTPFKNPKTEKELISLLRDAVSLGIPFTFKASGGSMFPTIPNRAKITIENFDSMPPKVGTICVAQRNGNLVCHRFIGIKKTEDGRTLFLLKGDSHKYPDPPYEENDMLGKVTEIILGSLKIKTDILPMRIAGYICINFPFLSVTFSKLILKIPRPIKDKMKALLNLLNFSSHGYENH